MSVTRAGLVDLVEQWRALLVPEWRVLLMTRPHPDSDNDPAEYVAEAQCPDDYLSIRVHFTDDLARDRADVEVTIVHELLHALTRPWRAQIDGMAAHLPQVAYTALRGAAGHEEEQLVDRLARVLVSTRYGPAVADVAYGTRTEDNHSAEA